MSQQLINAAREALEVLGHLQGGCTDSGDGTVEAITVWCPEVIESLQVALATAEAQPATATARVPLTGEQVFASEEFMTGNGLHWGLPMTTLMQIVRCTERAHGIGGEV